jgi:hypothetical protein
MRFALALLVAATLPGMAQDVNRLSNKLPITITIFSESVGLPDFRNIFRNGNLGIRVGTELYYRNRPDSQYFQNVQVGYYRHRELHHGLFVSSEIGYRKFFNQTFVDATIGGGFLVVNSAMPRYRMVGGEYQKLSSTFGRFMPTLGLGAGYQFKAFSVYSRYELFGEVPFGFQGVPALPHKALHLGTRFNIK